MKELFRHIVAFFSLLIVVSAQSQTDTVYVITKYKYNIENGKIGTNKRAINQKTYDYEGGVLKREVRYNYDTYQPDSILYYHYKSNIPYVIEIVNANEELIGYIQNFIKKKKVIESKTYTFDNGEKKLINSVKNKYSKNSNTSKTYKNGELSNTKETLFENKNITKVTNIDHSGNFKTVTIYNYKDDNQIISLNQTQQEISSEKTDSILIKYKYQQNQLYFKEYYSIDNTKPFKKVRTSYYDNGKIKYISIIEGDMFTAQYMFTYRWLDTFHPPRKLQVEL